MIRAVKEHEMTAALSVAGATISMPGLLKIKEADRRQAKLKAKTKAKAAGAGD